jgi:hypothetical protein
MLTCLICGRDMQQDTAEISELLRESGCIGTTTDSGGREFQFEAVSDWRSAARAMPVTIRKFASSWWTASGARESTPVRRASKSMNIDSLARMRPGMSCVRYGVRQSRRQARLTGVPRKSAPGSTQPRSTRA